MGLAGFVAEPELINANIATHLLNVSEGNLVRIVGFHGVSWLILRDTDVATHAPYVLWVLNHDTNLTPFFVYPPDAPDAWKSLAEEKARFAHPDIFALVSATPASQFIPPASQSYIDPATLSFASLSAAFRAHPRVTLLGDAMHAMTTHRGLGANTAFLDAVDLTEALVSVHTLTSSLSHAIDRYHRLASSRGAKNISESLHSSRTLHTLSPFSFFFVSVFLRILNFFFFLFRYIKSFFV